MVRVSRLNRTKTVSVIPRGVLRETSSRYSPLPSHNISQMPYHTRRRTAKSQVSRLRTTVTTQPAYPYVTTTVSAIAAAKATATGVGVGLGLGVGVGVGVGVGAGVSVGLGLGLGGGGGGGPGRRSLEPRSRPRRASRGGGVPRSLAHQGEQLLYVCMYICMYVCMYIYMCTYTCGRGRPWREIQPGGCHANDREALDTLG